MRIADVRGVTWTVGTERTADALFAAMISYFTFRKDAMTRLDDLLREDPEVPAGYVLKGALLMFSRSAQNVPAALDALEKAEALLALATDRERLHALALRKWIEGDVLSAQNVWDAILADEPHDLLALRFQHFNAMFLGRPDHLRALASRALADWNDDIPGAGFVYGMGCMGLEEAGEFARAERLGRRGADLEPEDLWCVHSVAHVMEAQGRLKEGLAWMVRPDSFWDGRGPMRHHLWWHEALFLYEAGDCEATLAYYDSRLATAEKLNYMELSNAASLLLRLEAAGTDCGARWDALASGSREMISDRSLAFTDVHALIAFSMAEDGEALRSMAEAVVSHASKGRGYNAECSALLVRPFAEAVTARRSGEAAKATDILLGARFEFSRMGGSNAQRDVLEIYLIDCAISAGKSKVARRLLNQYLDVRPESVPMRSRLAELDTA
jgi:hypothetical protein